VLQEEKVINIEINETSWRVKVDGKSVHVSAQQFKMLMAFARNPDRLLTRDNILDAVWGEDVMVDDRRVDHAVKEMRRVIGKRAVETVRSIGYRFNQEFCHMVIIK
jgi:DNA-binding response OmpR family regulator